MKNKTTFSRHTTGGLYDSLTLTGYVHATHPHTRPHAPPPHTHFSFTPDISPQDWVIHSKYGTNHEHELEGYFSVGEVKFRFFGFLNFLLQKHFTWSKNPVIRVTTCYLGIKVCVLTPGDITTTLCEKRRVMHV